MRVGKFCFRSLNLSLILAVALNPVFAQSKKPADASLRVTVVDPNGEAIPNARVVIGKQSQETQTGVRGDAAFAQLATGKIQIQVSATGFATRTIKDFSLRAGTNQIEIKLQI